jgi:hypothetical protein
MFETSGFASSYRVGFAFFMVGMSFGTTRINVLLGGLNLDGPSVVVRDRYGGGRTGSGHRSWRQAGAGRAPCSKRSLASGRPIPQAHRTPDRSIWLMLAGLLADGSRTSMAGGGELPSMLSGRSRDMTATESDEHDALGHDRQGRKHA